MAQFIQYTAEHPGAIRDELIAGLLAPQAVTSPKYLYDALGSKLFEAICSVPEYYPTRTEAEIFTAHAGEIAESVGTGATLIDLGAGNCAKAASLFPVLKPAQYVPLDISVDFLRDAVGKLQQQWPQIDMTGVGVDFSSALTLPEHISQRRRLFFYPGSSIGNFTPDESIEFLHRVALACKSGDSTDGGILISIDLVKDAALLDAAYDDVLGVTAAFNLNLLLHLNGLLNADFDVRQWRHRGFFNAQASRIEMHLEARTDITVRWEGGQRRFAEGERIHTENSYKYTQTRFLTMLEHAGFAAVRTWTDARGWFMVCHARAI